MKTKLQKIINDLAKWREDRNLTIDHQNKTFMANVLEEFKELSEATTESQKIDALCDLAIVGINSFETDPYSLMQALNRYDIYATYFYALSFKEDGSMKIHRYIAGLFDAMQSYGYNPIVCMQETIKEISSRRQDPKQKEEWDKLRSEGKKPTDKWKKDKNQTDTYKADYLKAKQPIKEFDIARVKHLAIRDDEWICPHCSQYIPMSDNFRFLEDGYETDDECPKCGKQFIWFIGIAKS